MSDIEKKITISEGLTLHEKKLIEDFFKNNPHKLNQLEDEKIQREKTLQVQQYLPIKNRKKVYKTSELTEKISYLKLKKMIANGIFKEKTHYLKEKGKFSWTQEAMDYINENLVMSEKEKNNFFDLYITLSSTHNLSTNAISTEISKETGKKQRAVYSFFYTMNLDKADKSIIKTYERAMIKIIEKLKG